MAQALDAWDKIQKELHLVVPSIKAGFNAMREHKALIGFLALSTIFGVAAGGSANGIIGIGLTVAGWAAMPYCWGRAILASNGGPNPPSGR